MATRPRDKQWSGTDSTRWRKRLAPLLPSRCPRCGKPVYPEQAWDVDHLIPLSQGGTKDASNLAAAHRSCNRSHGGKLGAAVSNRRRAEETGLINW